jgi:hypothetical protein
MIATASARTLLILALPALALAFALGLPQVARAADGPRFTAEAVLQPVHRQISANARFELSAALSATPQDSGKAGGRYELRAKLSSKATTAACGPPSDEIFGDGFEQQTTNPASASALDSKDRSFRYANPVVS